MYQTRSEDEVVESTYTSQGMLLAARMVRICAAVARAGIAAALNVVPDADRTRLNVEAAFWDEGFASTTFCSS
jgi:hypothetical protein